MLPKTCSPVISTVGQLGICINIHICICIYVCICICMFFTLQHGMAFEVRGQTQGRARITTEPARDHLYHLSHISYFWGSFTYFILLRVFHIFLNSQPETDRPGNALGGFKANLELSKTSSDLVYGDIPFCMLVGSSSVCLRKLNGQAHNDIEHN